MIKKKSFLFYVVKTLAKDLFKHAKFSDLDIYLREGCAYKKLTGTYVHKLCQTPNKKFCSQNADYLYDSPLFSASREVGKFNFTLINVYYF